MPSEKATRGRPRLARWLLLRWPPVVMVAFCGVIGILLPAGYGLFAGIPEPEVQDEFSYLLGADTFLHGRLTNPPPDFPEFFEASHVLVTPTYASKYPPGQSLVLALGQLISGRPIAGVWLSCGLFAASLCWMLLAWAPPRWALAGSVVAIVTLGVSTYWAQSYWGGMLAAAGGALLFGGLPRLYRRPRVVPSLLAGLGVVIMANTRMYEGLLVSIVPGALMVWWLVFDQRVPRRVKLVSGLAPFGAVLLTGGALMMAYNHAVTGRWLTPPHSVFSQQYFGQGVFLFSALEQPERQPIPRLASFYDSFRHPPRQGWRLIKHAAANLYGRLPPTIESGLGVIDHFEGNRTPYSALVLWLAALMAIGLQNKWARIGVASVIVVVLGQSIVWWWIPHYTAPVVPIVIAVAVLTLARQTRSSLPARTIGPPLVVVLALMYVAMPALWVVTRERFGSGEVVGTSFESSDLAGLTKTDVVRQLDAERGEHIVFVAYEDDGHAHNGEWVYNGADLRTSRVLFVHDLGDAKNAQLIAVYPERRSWQVSLAKNQKTARLEPYRRSPSCDDTGALQPAPARCAFDDSNADQPVAADATAGADADAH